MKDELIHFTHQDLDALGCMLNIEYALPQINKKHFFTNYRNIKDKTQEIIEYVQRFGNTHILITDVSWSNYREGLIELTQVAKCTLIDHHLYPDNFFDDIDIKVVHDVNKSATKLCNEYFNNTGKNKALDIFTNITNAFDIWLKDDPYFELGKDLNDYFWKYDITWLFETMVSNNYHLPRDYTQVMERHKIDSKDHILKLREKNLVHNNGTISIAFIDDFFNDLILEEFKNGAGVVLAVNSWGIVRVRIYEDFDMTPEAKDEVRLYTCGTKDIGHMNAFTFKIPHVNFEKIMEVIQDTSREIMEIIKKDEDRLRF